MILDRTMARALVLGAVVALGTTACGMFGKTDRSANGSTASTASAPARGPVQTTADASITAKVKTALAADELVKARNIDVDTVRGVVQLNGTVSSMAEKRRAVQLARNVSGVVEVKDNLKAGG